MKNIKVNKLIVFLVILVIGFTGCDDYLNETEIVNVESLESGFFLEQHADQAMTAIYAEFRDGATFNGRQPHVLFDASTADMKITRESNSVNNYTFNTSSDDAAFNQFWDAQYQLIGRANSAIEIVPQTEAPAEKVSRYNSEAKVLRAIAYYSLMMAYNTVPLVLETIDPGDREGMRRGDATREEIYNTMITDLEEAIANPDFPWEKDLTGVQKGHVGQATARTILTYYHLTRGWENNSNTDFDAAQKYSKQVIDQGGYSLEPVLLDAYYKWYSSEAIFEIISTDEFGLGSYVVPWFVPMTPADGENRRQYNGWFKMMMTQTFYDATEEGDARRYLLANPNHGDNNRWAPTFLGGDKYGGNLEVVDDINDNDLGLPTYQMAKPTGAPDAWLNRGAGPFEVNTTWVVYRLSDVYLLYAEASIKLGDEAEARTYINKVRERARNAWEAHLGAGNPDIPVHTQGIPADVQATTSGDALLDELKKERRIELAAEMKRMIDLRRWSLAGASDLQDDVNISGTWANRFKWFPKPQDQIDLSEGSITDGY